MLEVPSVSVFGLRWTFDPLRQEWQGGPLAFPVFAIGPLWYVRLPKGEPPSYAKQSEAMYWSVWHRASWAMDLRRELDEWQKAWVAFELPKAEPPKRQRWILSGLAIWS